MPRDGKRERRDEGTEAAIRRVGSIGALERLAGVGQGDAERYEFWRGYAHLPGAQGLDAGVAELKRRVRARGIAP